MRTHQLNGKAILGCLLAVGFIVTGCGSSKKATSAASTATTLTGAASATTAGPASKLPATVELVSIQDLTGVAGLPGQDAKKGMEVAVDEINSTKFLGDTKLSIKYEDSATNPTTGASLFTAAGSGNDPLAFGSVSSGTAVAEAPVAQRAKLPTIFTQAGSPGVVDAGNYIYRATPVQSSYIDLSGQYMQKKGFKRVAEIVAADIPTLTGLSTSFGDMASKYGYTVVDVEQTTSKATDLSSQVTKIVGQKPDAVVVLSLAGQNPTIITQLRQAGFTGQIIGQQGMAGGVLKPLGAAANGIVWATDFSPSQSGPGVAKFAKLYEAASGGSLPNNFGAEGYDAVWFAARALKAAGSVDRSAVLTGLGTLADQGFDGALGSVKFKNRDEVSSGVLVMWKDGAEVPVNG